MYKPVEVILGAEELENALYFWQQALRLQDWKVTLRLKRAYEMGEHIANCKPFAHSKLAEICLTVPEDFDPSELRPYDMERILVHELLHLHFWPLTKDLGADDAEEQAINSISDALIGVKRSKDYMQDFYEEELERLRKPHYLNAHIVDIRTKGEPDGGA